MTWDENWKFDLFWVNSEVLSEMHERTALILFYLRSSGLRVLTISPRNNPPISCAGGTIQLIF